MSTLPTLLLIEDNKSIAEALAAALASVYHVEIAYTGKTGLYRADSEVFDAIMLDLNLPDVSGMAVCQALRERGKSMPIVILTAETKTLSKIELLDVGANDYITKPFSLGELKARLRMQLRHERRQFDRLGSLEYEDIYMDLSARLVTRGNATVTLRRKEFDLLACLILHKSEVVPRQTLIDYAWQDSDQPWTNTLDVHMKHLRDKIDKPFGIHNIKTVHGLGYRLEAAELAEFAHA